MFYDFTGDAWDDYELAMEQIYGDMINPDGEPLLDPSQYPTQEEIEEEARKRGVELPF
jgi:hypothetical protein